MISSNSVPKLSPFFPSVSTTTYVLFILTLLVIGLFFKRRKQQKKLNIPGPWSLPFIGCMYLFRWSKSPHKTLANLTWVYGNVYCLNLGKTKVVVVNSADAVKEALYQRGSDFAGRPALFSFGLWGTEEETLMLRDYSRDFLTLKYKAEISMQELLNDEEFLSTRSLKAVQLLNNSFEYLALQNSVFDPEKIIKDAIADFVMDTVFGQAISRMFYHEARFVLEHVSSAFAQAANVGACVDFIPLMRYITRKTLTKTRSQVGQLRSFVRKVYRLHQHSLMQERDLRISLAYCLRSGDKGHRTVPTSFENSSNLIEDDDTIVFLLTDIMFCAYEKLSTSFRWCVARLAANKRLQRDIQNTIDEDFNHESEMKNRRLPLLAATVDETLRTSCIMPFGIPRKTTRDTTLQGYHIPKDTVILFNLWSCCHDSKCFSNPKEFDPYRYTNDTGKLSSYCAFSGGERKCLGDLFSRRFLVALTAGLLRTFELELVTPGSNTSLEGFYALTLRPKIYNICVRKREQNVKNENT